MTILAVAAMLSAGCTQYEESSSKSEQTTPGPASSPEQTNGIPATTPAPTTQELVTEPSTGTI